jgi:hypothetical protein
MDWQPLHFHFSLDWDRFADGEPLLKAAIKQTELYLQKIQQSTGPGVNVSD